MSTVAVAPRRANMDNPPTVGTSMHPTRLLQPLSACLLSVAAATQGPPRTARVLPYPIDLPDGFVAAVENGTRTRTGQPGAEHWTNYAHYDIALTVDPANSRVQGTAKMTYENRSPDELDRLIVHHVHAVHALLRVRSEHA